MRAKKSLVTVSAAAGLIASILVTASPAMAAQKSCHNNLISCKTGTLPANSTSHAITFCGKPEFGLSINVWAFDKDTGRQVGHLVTSTTGLKCTDIGGLYGDNYYAMTNGDGWAYISN